MDRQGTLSLWRQGRDAWNAWARELLERRDRTDGLQWSSEADVDFEGQNFQNHADFSFYIFPGAARFDHANFARGCDFRKADFGGECIFDRVTLSEQCQFDYASFSLNTRFCNARHHGWPSFQGASFNGLTQFDNAIFHNDVIFDRMICRATFSCSHAEFKGQSLFKEAIFGRHAIFNKNCRFVQKSDFGRAEFARSADFEDTTFEAEVDFSETTFRSASNFRRASFAGNASFLAARSERGFDLAGARFEEVPDFTQAHFEEAPRLDNLRIAKGKPDADLPARYRALKRLALQAHDHMREQEYFAGEIKASRHNSDKPLPNPLNLRKDADGRRRPIWPGGARYWFGRAYECLSDFGRSITRPVVWWLGSTVVFWLLYLYPKAPACVAGSEEPWSAALYLSIRKALPLIGVGSTEKLHEVYACLYGIHGENGLTLPERFRPVIPLSVEVLGMAQVLISLLLIFLFLLGLRNHFRIR